MSQVAKALLDSAPRGAAPQPPRPHAEAWAPEPVLTLLRFREDALTAEVAAAIGAAAKAAAPRGKAAAAVAGTDAFEDNLDRVLALGWAHVDRIAFEVRRSTGGNLQHFISSEALGSHMRLGAWCIQRLLCGACRLIVHVPSRPAPSVLRASQLDAPGAKPGLGVGSHSSDIGSAHVKAPGPETQRPYGRVSWRSWEARRRRRGPC